MMARLGIELGARTLRAVRLEGWYRTLARTVEIEWDGAHPAEAVAALRQHLGPARRIALALGRAGLATAVTVLDAEPDGVGVVEMCEGRVVRARRVFGGLEAVAAAVRHNGGTPATLYLRPWSEERVRALGALVPDAALRPLPAVGEWVGAF